MNWRRWWGRIGKASLWRSLVAVWFLVRDGRTPLASKAVAWMVLAYALSPVDLIPDFIPVLGLLDDLVLLPLGIWLAVQLAPAALWQDKLRMAQAFEGRLPRLLRGLLLVLALWLALLAALAWWLWTLAWSG